MKRSTIVTLLAVVATGGLVVVLMTSGQTTNRCRVCVTYRGHSNCASATACVVLPQTPAMLADDESIACGRVPPDSVQCRTR